MRVITEKSAAVLTNGSAGGVTEVGVAGVTEVVRLTVFSTTVCVTTASFSTTAVVSVTTGEVSTKASVLAGCWFCSSTTESVKITTSTGVQLGNVSTGGTSGANPSADNSMRCSRTSSVYSLWRMDIDRLRGVRVCAFALDGR